MRASIDIGSNSIILLIAKNFTGKSFTEVVNISSVTGLGKNLDKFGKFEENSKKESYKALSLYCDKIKEVNINPADVIVTATEASRVASDATDFFSEIKLKLGLNVSIINSDGEAYYTALGVSLGSNLGQDRSIIDIGGASSEIIQISVSPFKLKRSISLPIGSVRATDYISHNNYNKILDEIFSKFEIKPYSSKRCICVAGNMTTIACMMLKLDKYSEEIHGEVFSVNEISKFLDSIKGYSNRELLSIYPYIGKRSETIIGGTSVLLSLATELKMKEVEVSIYGLRHGTILEGVIDERFITRR